MIIKNTDWVKKNIDTLIFALAFECPHGNNPTLCPLNEFRLCSQQEKEQIIERLSEKEKLVFYEQHSICFKMRKKAP